jgi:hypothetical protein
MDKNRDRFAFDKFDTSGDEKLACCMMINNKREMESQVGRDG